MKQERPVSLSVKENEQISMRMDQYYKQQRNPIYGCNLLSKVLTCDCSYRWECLYGRVCNLKASRTQCALNERQRLIIALVFLKNTIAYSMYYTYEATHVIYGEECMLVQSYAFTVEEGDPREIRICDFDKFNKSHAIVRQIVFGNPSNPNVPEPALWFNVPDGYLKPIFLSQNNLSIIQGKWHVDCEEKSMSFNDFLENIENPFYFQTSVDDQCTCDLMLDILRHRLQTISMEMNVFSGTLIGGEKQAAIDMLQVQKLCLKETFLRLQRC